MSIAKRLGTSLYPARRAAWVRAGLGILAFVRAGEGARLLWPLTDSEIVKAPFFGWYPEPTRLVVATVLIAWAVSSVAFAAGFRPRISGTVLAISIGSSLLLDQQAYSNHLYLMTVLIALLAVSAPDRSSGPHDVVVGWPIQLMKLQITVVYVFAALTKLNEEYLSGAVLGAQLGRGLLDLPEAVATVGLFRTLAAASIVVELVIGIYLWVPHRRRLAIVAGIALHGSITLLMAPTVQLAVFSALMLLSYLLFVEEDITMPQTVSTG